MSEVQLLEELLQAKRDHLTTFENLNVVLRAIDEVMVELRLEQENPLTIRILGILEEAMVAVRKAG